MIEQSPLRIRNSPPLESLADGIYRELRDRAIAFEFRPGERLNENGLAKHFGVSRTPLREALNRLRSEGLLSFSANEGFCRKPLEVKEIFDLYEFRGVLEVEAMKLVVERATAEQLTEVDLLLERESSQMPVLTPAQAVALDEACHEQLIALSGNDEMLRCLKNINARIRYVRCIDLETNGPKAASQHKAVLRKLQQRDADGSASLMSDHIAQSLDRIVENLEKCYGRIYASGHQNGNPRAVIGKPA